MKITLTVTFQTLKRFCYGLKKLPLRLKDSPLINNSETWSLKFDNTKRWVLVWKNMMLECGIYLVLSIERQVYEWLSVGWLSVPHNQASSFGCINTTEGWKEVCLVLLQFFLRWEKATKRACGLKKYYGYQNHCGIIFQNIKNIMQGSRNRNSMCAIFERLCCVMVELVDIYIFSITLWDFENSGAKSFTCRILLEKLVGKLVLLFCVNWREKDANAIVVLIVDFSHKAIAPFHLLPLFTRNGEVKRI